MINYKNIKSYSDCVFEVLAHYYFDTMDKGDVEISNKYFERLNSLQEAGRISEEECDAITFDIACLLDHAIRLVSLCPDVDIKIKHEQFESIIDCLGK